MQKVSASEKIMRGGRIRPLVKGEVIKNKSGSNSTERLIGVDHPELNGGRPTLIPTLYMKDGKIVRFSSITPEGKITVSREQQRGAIQAAMQSGLQYPDFNTFDESTVYAKQRSAAGGTANGPIAKPKLQIR